MPELTANTLLNTLFTLGLGQVTWFFSMLVRRGIRPANLWQATSPLLAIWVVMWPVYTINIWFWFPIAFLLLTLLFIYTRQSPFTRSLRMVWGTPLPWHMLALIASIMIAMLFFQEIPEFGFALGLMACFSFPLADLLDRYPNIKLPFPLHPEQTLFGHLGLILSSSLLCSWSIHLYHGINWQQLLIATLIAGMAASIIRALLPRPLSLPIATLAMGWILWLL